jgi:hypothetical protein
MQDTMSAWRLIELLAMIEVDSKIELAKQLSTTVRCPRETVRFFHQRNSCDCLHEIYYKLKDTTQRTTSCWNCKKVTEVKKVFHCKCDQAKYCSKKCALDDLLRHKERCRHARESI